MDEALTQCPSVKSVLVYQRTGTQQQMAAGPRSLVARTDGRTLPTNARPSRSIPNIRFTCSTLPAPPASRRAFCTPPAAIRSPPTSRRNGSSICATKISYWCTADIGWVTGHSYVVYGPLQNGATVLMYEGGPTHPAAGPLLGDDRPPQGHDLLHRAHRHPRVHAPGRTMARASIR